MPVWVLVATTVAPEITAPLESVTTPEMLPVMLAQAVAQTSRNATLKRLMRRFNGHLVDLPSVVLRDPMATTVKTLLYFYLMKTSSPF